MKIIERYEELKNDYIDIVKIAILKDGLLLEFAGAIPKDNIGIVKLAMENI